MRKNTGRRVKPSFAYRGNSQNHSNSFTFNRRPPFSRIKQIYGEELERFELESNHQSLQSKELLTQQKKEIKERTLKHFREEQKQNFVIISSLIVFVFLLIIFINYYFLYLIKSFWS